MQAETRNKKKLLRTERLPSDMKGVTADWLSRILRLEYPDIVVKNMEVVEFIGGHDTKLRLKLDLNKAGIDAGIPEHVCLKSNLEGHAPSLPVGVNEARFYNFYRESKDVFTIPAPACYFADWDDDAVGQQGLMIIDDLIELGGTFGTSANPIGVDEMARSLEGLAAIHGSTWASKELAKQTWLQTAMAPETVTDDYWSMIPDYFDAHNKIPERIALFPQWMADDPSRLRKASAALRAHESKNKCPRCLIHGDAHLGNSYLRPDGKRIWFDWQIVRKGLPWRDVTYFIIGSIEIEDRRKAERDLLRHYLDHFAAMGGKKFTFDEVWEEYRRMVIWGLVAWQSNINPGEKTMPPLERFCMAAKDLETHKLLEF
ncbi:MAG: ecdysteroid 22-kinase family protein [Proteobacteria bacterium]|nr:ecdysteroid 22-kinase family protein [Pseudomonadota bacterium]